MNRILMLALLLPLAGCPQFQAASVLAPGAAGDLTTTVTNTLDAVDSSVDQEVLNRAARIHNLQIGLGQINSASGMVSTVPTIVTATTPVPPAPAPTPTPVPPAPSPAPQPIPVPPAPIPAPKPVPVVP